MSLTSTLRLVFLIAFLLPLATHAAWWLTRDHPRSWADADWTSAHILAPASRETEAVVYVLAARTGRWKGIFAHHTWLVVKPKRASRYTRFDVVGWGRPVRINVHDADARWYGNAPRILLALKGAEAERVIPRLNAAVAGYPYAALGSYTVWPGPNSNTFIAWLAREVPEIATGLLPTALGKDYAGFPIYFGRTPSGTGLQISIAGIAGLSVGWIEGVEVNLLGLVAGFDVRRPALKLPGWGRLGPAIL